MQRGRECADVAETAMMERTEAAQGGRPGPDLAVTAMMRRPAKEEHDEHEHVHQVNLHRYIRVLVLRG